MFLKNRLLLILCFGLLPSVQGHSSGGPHENLKALGFTLLQGTPIDFKLSLLNGGQHSLSSQRGKWIWLAFWATWCGPCTEEIPSLNRLFQKIDHAKLAMLAVSVDRDEGAIQTFKRDHALTIPIVWDSSGIAASKYQATALPIIYVISPDWKLVGVLRGAREWDSPEANELLKGLVQFRKYPDVAPGVKMAEDDGALSLPNNLAPPILNVALSQVRVNQFADLSVSITWKGDSKDYVLKPPKFTLPDGVTQGELSSSSRGENDQALLQYHLKLMVKPEALKEGKLTVGPIEVAYQPRTGGKELFARHEGIVVEAQAENHFRIIVPLLCALSLALAVFLSVFWMFRRKKRAAVKPQTDWSGPFQAVRLSKLQGDLKKYATDLLRLSLEIDRSLGKNDPKLNSLSEKVQFGGYTLTETEMSYFEKRIERAIQGDAV